MSIYEDLKGTNEVFFKIGRSGVGLKDTAGNLTVRNTGDTADAEITTSRLKVSGDDIVINSDAVSSGADFLYTLRRPATGQTGPVIVTLPAVSTTLGGSTADKNTLDKTDLVFGSAATVAMFTLPANARACVFDTIVDTPFSNTSAAFSIGIAGNTTKYVPVINLQAEAGDIIRFHPSVVPPVTDENLIITYISGGSTTGAARIYAEYAVAS